MKHWESWVVWMAIASCASPRQSHATKCLLRRQTESQRDFVHHRRLARAGRVACLRCVRGCFKVVKSDITGVLGARRCRLCVIPTHDGAHRFRPRGAVGNTRGRVFSPGKGWLRVAGRVFLGWVHDGFEVTNVILRGFWREVFSVQ